MLISRPLPMPDDGPKLANDLEEIANQVEYGSNHGQLLESGKTTRSLDLGPARPARRVKD